MLKPTNQNIATFYGVHKNTINNYKNGDEFKKLLYEAMKEYFIANSQ
jgi:hypothetical protein